MQFDNGSVFLGQMTLVSVLQDAGEPFLIGNYEENFAVLSG